MVGRGLDSINHALQDSSYFFTAALYHFEVWSNVSRPRPTMSNHVQLRPACDQDVPGSPTYWVRIRYSEFYREVLSRPV